MDSGALLVAFDAILKDLSSILRILDYFGVDFHQLSSIVAIFSILSAFDYFS